MIELAQKIRDHGTYLGNGILKVDGFLNHQIDAGLMYRAGQEFAKRFVTTSPDIILTAEISGIAPAAMAGLAMNVPVVYARKHRPITMPENVYTSSAPSHTKGKIVQLMVSPEFLKADQRVLIIDDFLATGKTLNGLVDIVSQAGGDLVGIGAVIEKSFEGGREMLTKLGVQIESLAIIDSLSDAGIEVRAG